MFPTSATSSADLVWRFEAKLKPNAMRTARSEALGTWPGHGLAVAVTASATAINYLMAPHVELTNLVMVYLLGVTYVASRSRPGAGVLASLLSVAAFDFCFVHPSGTFAVADIEYLFTFAVMLGVSLMISTLTIRLREQSKARGDAAFQAQVEQMRGDLLSAVSHDLRTPLASIEGSAAVLARQPDLNEPSRQLATTIQEESVRMSRLVRNLLDMTRVQGTIDLDLDWNGLDELAANAILRTESLFSNPVTLEVGARQPLARVDGVLVEQVLVNLLENAARYAGKEASVRIGINPIAGGFRVTVDDNGPGVPAADLERLFQRFQGTNPKGFGLGLAICRAAVEAHGGRIWAQNRDEGGAMFAFELPENREVQVA